MPCCAGFFAAPTCRAIYASRPRAKQWPISISNQVTTMEPGGQTNSDQMPGNATGSWYRQLATSQKPFPRFVRRARRAALSFSVPAPRVVFKPILLIYIAVRSIYYSFLRIFICEPLFKAYCKKYGRGLHTDCYIHWVRGKGDIVIGDDVRLDGKSTIVFGARFTDRPVLDIGDNTGIGHDCLFVIGRRITIGRNCILSGGTTIRDSNGHSADPVARADGEPPYAENVRAVVIGADVWIGTRCLIFPGVKIGQGSVISAGSVVHTHVPPYSVVAGNPARVMFRLKKPNTSGQAGETQGDL